MENYKVKQEDLIGELKGFPIEVVQAMVDEQVKQGSRDDVSVFQDDKSLGGNKGFLWDRTKEGALFWEEVIGEMDFDIFFEKYPKKDYTTVICNEETIKNAIQVLKNEGYRILKPKTEWEEV